MQPVEVARLVAKYWPKDQWVTAVAVAGGESDWNERSLYTNQNTGDKSYGLFQVNMEGDLMAERLRQYNLKSADDLYDPATNVRVAWGIYVAAGGWSPWGAYKDGGMHKFGRYEKAQAAVAALGGTSTESGGNVAYQIQHKVVWRGPVPNESGGFQRPAHGVVLHIMDGTLDGTDSWFHNPSARASSDYGVGKDGRIYQWVNWETDWKAWAEAAGNPYWVSIENEGHTGDSLTQAQLVSNAQIVAHVFSLDGVPFQTTDEPMGRGLGWHGMGGNGWGGHFDCPGEPIKAQRPAILALAKTLVGGGEEDELNANQDRDLTLAASAVRPPTNDKGDIDVVHGKNAGLLWDKVARLEASQQQQNTKLDQIIGLLSKQP